MAKVTIQNQGRTVEIADNANLREALKAINVSVYNGPRKLFNCRGKGHCGSCEILVMSGSEHLTPRTVAEHKILKTYDLHRRLACQVAINGDAEIEINTLAI
ncbi:MAG: ferredoxin [Planctomycetota bacterium]|jgi:ferredoxin